MKALQNLLTWNLHPSGPRWHWISFSISTHFKGLISWCIRSTSLLGHMHQMHRSTSNVSWSLIECKQTNQVHMGKHFWNPSFSAEIKGTKVPFQGITKGDGKHAVLFSSATAENFYIFRSKVWLMQSFQSWAATAAGVPHLGTSRRGLPLLGAKECLKLQSLIPSRDNE